MNLADKLDLLVKALGFYSRKENYQGPTIISKGNKTVRADEMSAVLVDRGQLARDTIDIIHREVKKVSTDDPTVVN